MIASDHEIRGLLDGGEFVLEPREEALIQPSSVDLRLGRNVRRLQGGREVLNLAGDLDEGEAYADLEIPVEGVILAAGEALLGQTFERMTLPATFQGVIEQRSSLVRLGVQVTSSLVNPGYVGNLPLLIVNLGRRPILLHSEMPVCQLVLHHLTNRPGVTYPEKPGAKYQGERMITASRVAEDVRRWSRPPSLSLVDPSQASSFRKEAIFEDDDDEIL